MACCPGRPDSKTLVAWRIEPGDGKEVYLIESSPTGGGRAKFSKRPYALPGDKFTTYELNLFDIETRKQIKPEVDRFELDWETPRLHWKRTGGTSPTRRSIAATSGSALIEVDSHTGQARNLIDEKTETFIWTAHTENLDLRLVNWLDKSDEILYVSERDGWRHLYLVDAARARCKIRSPRASGSCAASIASTRTRARSGSTPAARTRTRTRISSTTIASTSTAPDWWR